MALIHRYLKCIYFAGETYFQGCTSALRPIFEVLMHSELSKEKKPQLSITIYASQPYSVSKAMSVSLGDKVDESLIHHSVLSRTSVTSRWERI